MSKKRYRPSIRLSDAEIRLIRSRLHEFMTDEDVVAAWIKAVIASELGNLA